MKKKKILIIIISVFAAVLILIASAFAFIIHKGYGITAGRALITDNDTYMLIDESSPIVISTKKDKNEFFKDIETGDRILVIHDGIEETYPAQTGAYLCIKLEDGSVSDINSEILIQLAEMGWLSDEYSGVTIDKMLISVSDSNAVVDMIGFFIYNGRSYVSYESLDDDSLKGDYIGRATGSIDEWSSPDDYIEFSGSTSGDIYTVNGYGEDFMLCIDNKDGTVTTYINNNDITMIYGYELFRDRLKLAENYTSVAYQTRGDWYYSTGEPTEFDNSQAVDEFIDTLYSSRFMYTADIPLDSENSSVYDEKEIYHLFFKMNNGTTVHLRLFSGGYVMFAGISDVCVKVDKTVFENLTELLSY
ncbi:MAG: hypothetical protein IJZ35_05745 [Clostridia bacterium]|nr:hypothetical protein [Clostridia bacterium]